jgi:AraC-like DNA-binding protein
MRTLYDTRTVHPFDRYEHYRAGAGIELAPVSVQGCTPDQLLAVMSVATIGDIEMELITWRADRAIVAKRTERLIRICDPGCYRLLLSITPGLRLEQAGHCVDFQDRDIVLYDMALPWTAVHPVGPRPMVVLMLTFPRSLLPLDAATIEPLIGTRTPRKLAGRNLIAQFLIGLVESDDTGRPELADILLECAVGLVRRRLGHTSGITPATGRLLHQERIRNIIRQHMADRTLDPEKIAHLANISPRYLHAIFHGTDETPMQLLKRLRLDRALTALRDPAFPRNAVQDVMSSVGYARADQFARDFRNQFGMAPSHAREIAGTEHVR